MKFSKVLCADCAVPKSRSAHERVANIWLFADTLPPRRHQVDLVINDCKDQTQIKEFSIERVQEGRKLYLLIQFSKVRSCRFNNY